ncbi:MAG: cyclic peptide export ABC transporter [Cyanobacteriota bacterium]|nr:cyclic peptide export ABC transporter [Cyanobacteriota bacterium]
MNLFSFLLRSSGKMVAIAIAAGILSGGSSAALIALVSRAIANSSPPLTLAWGFLGLACIALTTSIFTRVVLIRLSQDAVYRLQMRLCRQILASEFGHLEQLGPSRLLASLTEDVQTISNAVYVLPFLGINLAIVAGGLLYITWLSWQVFIIVMGVTAVALMSSRVLLRQGRNFLVLARNDQDRLYQHFQTITEGIKELKLHAFRRQDFLKEDLEVTAQDFRRHNLRGLSLFATTDSWGKLIFFFAIGLVLFVLPHWLAIAPQTLAGYVLTFTYLMGPMENIVNKLPLIGKANIALEKIETLGLALAQYAEAANHQPLTALESPTLELKGIVRTYPSDDDTPFVLGPIDLAFNAGELVFIVGGNGSGKSTLAKLIAGLYLPEAGEMRWNGELIAAENREGYRQNISAIFSDFYLFDRLLGFDRAGIDERARHTLQTLHLEGKVRVERGKFSTTALSTGQRKRLALLTAYLEDRPMYLFDEWAADQDPAFKEIFYRQLLPQLRDRGKIVLAIGHDDRYFGECDRLIKLDCGRVVGDRRRSELRNLENFTE